MRSNWRLFLFIGLILPLASSAIGCGESYTQEDLDAAYKTGHAEGYEAGSLEGYKVGYTEGKDAGLAELESAQATPIDESKVHFEQGNIYLEQEELYRAIYEYTQAIELNPEFAEAYANRGAACLEQLKYDLSAGHESNYKRAIADCEKAIELNPLVNLKITLAEAYVQRGYYFNFHARDYHEYYDKAIADYTMAMKLDPLSRWRGQITSQRLLDVYWGLIYDSLTYHEYDKAIEYSNKAIELNTGDNDYYYRQLAEAYYGRGYDHWRHGGFPFDEAIADYTRAIELNPTNAEYYLSRAYIYETLADVYRDHGEVSKEVDSKNKAIADYKKAEELQAK